MTKFRPPLTDARLDRMLDRWLTEGPESVADRVPNVAQGQDSDVPAASRDAGVDHAIG